MKKRIYLTDEKTSFQKVMETLLELCMCATVGLFIASFLLFSVDTESRAMEPSIEKESQVYVNRTAYILQTPDRFDIVAFKRVKEDPENQVLIRRVVGLPGERIQIKKGIVYVNGSELDIHPYISEITSDGIAEKEIVLGDREYFVLGDMPANSEDSRSSTIGAVSSGLIIGEAWLTHSGTIEFSILH